MPCGLLHLEARDPESDKVEGTQAIFHYFPTIIFPWYRKYKVSKTLRFYPEDPKRQELNGKHCSML